MTGLSTREAAEALRKYGKNSLGDEKKKNPLTVFAGQFRDGLVLVLAAGAAVSVLLGEVADGVIIAVILVLNALLGFSQEYRTEKTLAQLKKLAAPTARVLRDGQLVPLPAEEIVPRDIIKLEAGDIIPADCEILECAALLVNEALLTGESFAVQKKRGDTLYMGTAPVKGRAVCRVTATGASAEMGKIGSSLSEIEEEQSPLQKRLAELSKIIGLACAAICALVVAALLFRGSSVWDGVFTGLTLAVAAIPEGLPAAVTISLALAVRRIYKQNALINKLRSVETLGCVDVICTDKTGTLTQNDMTVAEIVSECKEHMLNCMKYCGNAEVVTRGKSVSYSGEPTETALLRYATENGVTAEPAERLSEIPFDSDAKYMSVTVKIGGRRFEYIKGSPEKILQMCGISETGGGSAKNDAESMASRALRTISLAYREAGSSKYTFLGTAGLRDPIRPEVPAAVRKCLRAGIRIKMLTGDHPETALEIARQAGIADIGGKVLTGADIADMSDEQLTEAVKHTSVFARTKPSDKLRIIRLLKAQGHITAMTGDGVNDAPAVKEAAIGVAMGTGSAVTKDAAAVVLLDDNFAALVSAVSQGRTIYANIKKFIRYMLSCNIGEVAAMLLCAALPASVLSGGSVTLLLPIQILLINLVTDGLPAVALSMEPQSRGIMEVPPRSADESVFVSAGAAGAKRKNMLPQICVRGVLIGIMTLAAFLVTLPPFGVARARTAALCVLGFSQLVFAFECKEDGKGIFNVSYLSNPRLILANLLSAGLLAVVMCTDLLSSVMQTEILPPVSVITVALCSLAVPVINGVRLLIKGT